MHHRLLAGATCAFSFALGLAAQTPVVTWSGETMHLRSGTVTPAGGTTFNVALTMEDDNNNASLGSAFRRWWHCQIGSLNPAGTTLVVTVGNAGYTDTILPVWALSTDGGASFAPYTRCPTSAVPTQPTASSHRFTITTPAGVNAIRLAKYFPYPVTRKDAWLQGLASHPHVRSITTIGQSLQNRPIQMVELTDQSVPDTGKDRVWIHAGVHPSETTSYFTVEGLVAWLGSGDPYAETLLDHTILDIVPMSNPDGVALGNYRTTANSVNLENEWGAPYNSTQPEIVAMRTQIESFMGTPAAPGANPIVVVFNLHSSHGVSYPFHFQHTANANWNPTSNNSGVLPIVNQIEGDWIADFRAFSPFAALGATQSSTAGAPSRPFVESMMHDRWSAVAQWTGAPAFQEPVMAITFEGTYGFGPTAGVWNTEADYRQCGAEMGRALAEYRGLGLTASVTSHGSPCHVLSLAASLTAVAGGHQASLGFGGAPPNSVGIFAFGFQPALVQLPAPWQACAVRNSADASLFVPVSGFGTGLGSLFLPNWPGLAIHAQVVALDFAQPGVFVDTSNGLELGNDF